MIFMGVDPGFRFSGFGILQKDSRRTMLIDHGYLSMSPHKSLEERVGIFYNFFFEKIKVWNVSDIALETSFLGKNAQNFLKLGYLRGLIYLLANQNKLQIHEFSPREIKMLLTGFGGASKDQVAHVVLKLFPGIQRPKKHDVTDALAITLCGMWEKRL